MPSLTIDPQMENQELYQAYNTQKTRRRKYWLHNDISYTITLSPDYLTLLDNERKEHCKESLKNRVMSKTEQERREFSKFKTQYMKEYYKSNLERFSLMSKTQFIKLKAKRAERTPTPPPPPSPTNDNEVIPPEVLPVLTGPLPTIN